MALLQRTRILPNERLDLPDFNNIEDFACADFKAIHKNVWSSDNFAFSGFVATGVGTNTLSVVLAGSSAIFSKDDGVLFIGAPALAPLATTNLIPSATNFVEIFINQDTGGADSRAFWDTTANGGQGGEFAQIIDTFTFIKANFAINTSNFTGDADKLAICEVDVNGSGVITAIRDARNMFWRLGRHGNDTFSYSWNSRVEPPTTQFNGADKDISRFKQWADAVMTTFKEIKGTAHWYEFGSISLPNLMRIAALNTIAPLTAGAKVTWDGTNLSITDSNGSPSSTDHLAALRFFDSTFNVRLNRQDGTGGSAVIPIADGEVLWVQLPSPLAAVDYSGIGVLASNYRVTNRGSVPNADTTFWLAYREGSTLLFRDTGALEVGESIDIGDEVPQTLLANIGLIDEVTPPSYSSNIRGVTSQSIVARVGVLTDAVGDEQEDRSAYLRSDNQITWTGTQLQFTSDLVLEIINTKNGTLTRHTVLAANSPLTINNGDSIYVSINRTSASETATPINSSSVAIPAQTQANKDIFVLFRRVDALSVGYLHIPFHKQVLEPGQTVRLGASGSGSGTGSGVGDDLNTLKYQASFSDTFQSTPISSGSTNISAGFTDPANYSAQFKLWTFNYDASKTVTGTGTAMTLSANPSFTIKAGDVLVVAGEVRRITVVTTQSSITIESAFSVNPSAAACTVSQALYTVDLNNFSGTGLAISGALPSSFNEILTDYADNNTPSSIILALGVTPNVAYTASADGTNFSKSTVRTNNVTDSDGSLSLPTTGTNLYMRFFANKSSGSGIVNFLKYKVFLHAEQPVTAFGFTLNQAYGFTDGSGSFVNASTSVVAGKTRISLLGGFTYTPAVNPGTPNGQLFILLGGEKFVRFINATATPDRYFKEIDSTTVELDADYSGMSLQFEVLRLIAAQDFNAQNGVNIANINSHRFTNGLINSNFDFWQRGKTFSTPTSGLYTTDRWRHEYDGTIGTFTISRQLFTLGQGAVPNEPSYFLRWNQTAAGSGSTFRNIGQRIESVRSYAGNQVTIAFWAKADSARSVSIALKQNFGTSGSPSSDVLVTVGTASLTTAWQQFSFSVQVPSINGKTLGTDVNDFLEVRLLLPINTTMTIDLAQAQINEGPATMPWQMAGREIREELALCQRFFEKSYDTDVDPGTFETPSNTTRFYQGAIAALRLPSYFKVTKRIGPNTLTAYSGVSGTANNVDVNNVAIAATAQSASTNAFWVENNTNTATGSATYGYEWTAEAEL